VDDGFLVWARRTLLMFMSEIAGWSRRRRSMPMLKIVNDPNADMPSVLEGGVDLDELFRLAA